MSSTATLVRFIALAFFALVALPLEAQVQRHNEGRGDPPGHNHELQPAPKFNARAELSFTENRGQIIDTRGEARPDILYRSESQGMHLYFRKEAISYVFVRWDGDMLEYSRRLEVDHTGNPDPPPTIHYYRTDMELVGANPNVQVIAEDTTEDFINYYLGYLPSQDIRNVRSFRRLIYRDVYPNIDMVVNGGVNGMKCDFVVRPGGNPSDIRMRYLAADGTSILTSGALRVVTPEGYMEMEAPYTYQHDLALARQTVTSRYAMKDGVIGFEVGTYDRSRPLVIDPFLLWSTFFGGTGAEDMAGGDPSEVDRNGNVLITGNTQSTQAQQFPLLGAWQATHGGGADAFITKYSSSGTRLWSTYWGGTRDEMGHGIATDVDGNVFMTGHTIGNAPNNLPTFNAYQPAYGGTTQRDAIVAKFTPSGGILWATYLGGAQWDDGYGFAVDSTGNVCVAITTGSNFTTPLNGAKPNAVGNGDAQYDVLLVKFNAAGAFVWSYYYGGTAMEYVYGATSDIKDNIIITGWTQSTNAFPIQNAAQPGFGGATDAFVAKFSSNGTLKWSTYYGGGGTENYVGFGAGIPGGPGYSAITSDPVGNTFVTGYTTGQFPTFGGVFQPGFQGGTNDGYIIKFDTNGVREWASYVGGSGRDIGVGVASNSQGGVLISGFTASQTLFPITFPPGAQAAFQNVHQGGPAGNVWDAFIVKLKKDGAQTWGTYLGGPGDDQGQGISFDPYGSLVVTGVTTSAAAVPPAGFPILAADQNVNRGGVDAFVSMFCDPDPPRIDSSGSLTFCNPDSVRLSVIPGYTEVRWYKLGAPDILITTQDTITIKETGRWYVRVKNAGGCTSYSDTLQTTRLDRINPAINPGPTINLCTGDTATLSVTPGPFVTFRWTNQAGAQVGSASTYKATTGGTYKVVITNAKGCIDSATVLINEFPKPADISVTPADTVVICEGDTRVLTAAGGAGGTIVWSNGGVGSTLTVSTAGTYTAKSVGPSGCEKISNKVIVKVNKKPLPKILPILPVSFCEGDSTVLAVVQTPGGPLTPYRSYLWSPGGETTDKIVRRTSGDVTVTVTDTNGCQNTATVTVTVNEKPKPKLVISPDSVICEGDSVLLSLDQGYAGYQWSTGSADSRIKVGRSGVYFVTVSNFGGCQGRSDTVNIRVVPSPVANISGAISVCTNTPASYSVPAGTGLSYAWKVEGPSGTISSGTNSPTVDVNWGSAGTNRVIVTVTDDASGCKAIDTVSVEVGSVLVPNITYIGSTRLCPGDSIVLDAGPGYTKYNWSPGGQGSRTITVKTAGTYRVSVENAGGCSGTSNPVDITIGTPPTPVITVEGGKTSLCPGDTVWLDAGAGYRDYTWSNGFSNRRIPVWRTDSLMVSVTDTSGCTGVSQKVYITMNTPPAPVITGPNSVCINSTDDYEVAGDPGDTYQWQVLGTGGTITGGAGTSKLTVRWSTAGTDTLELVQISAATGCRGTTRYIVEVGTTLNPVIASSRIGAFCDGDSVTLTAPAGYSTYLWDNGPITQSIVVKTPGTYRVTVTDDGGCSGSGEITVTQKARLDPKIVPDGMPGLCPGDSISLAATPGFASYRWAPTGDTARVIWVKAAGTYTVTVTDIDSCVGVSAGVDVTLYPVLAQPKIITAGDTLVAIVDVIDSPQPAQYQWSLNGTPISGATAQRYKYAVVGSYTVTVVDSNGCVATSEPFTPTSFAFATVEVPVVSAVPGQRIKIPVMLDSSENLDRNSVHGFEAKLRFNATLLIPADGRPSVIQGHDRVVTITGTRQPTVASGELAVLEFIAALGDTTETALVLETFRFSDTANGPVPVTIVNGFFRLEGLCENGGTRLVDVSGAVRLKQARPNPTGDRAQIEYEVVESGRTELYVVDLLGKRVATLVEGEIEAGSYMVELDATRLESGTYLYILQTPTERLARMIQVVR